MREIMKRAHELAKKMEGNYTARLALALKMAWAEQSETLESKIEKLIQHAKEMRDLDCKVWERYDEHRIYVSRMLSRGRQTIGYIDLKRKTFRAERRRSVMYDLAEMVDCAS